MTVNELFFLTFYFYLKGKKVHANRQLLFSFEKEPEEEEDEELLKRVMEKNKKKFNNEC